MTSKIELIARLENKIRTDQVFVNSDLKAKEFLDMGETALLNEAAKDLLFLKDLLAALSTPKGEAVRVIKVEDLDKLFSFRSDPLDELIRAKSFEVSE